MLKSVICAVLTLLSLNALAFTIFGHRGARGLVPENTIPAIQKALDLKVDAIDVDVVMSKDKQLMVYHDLTLNPDTTKDMHGNWVKVDIVVKELTAKELQNYKVTQIRQDSNYAKIFPQQVKNIEAKIPTLQEVIKYIKQHANYPIILQIELKNDPQDLVLSASSQEMAHTVNEIILAENFTKYSKIQAFDWWCLQLLQKLNPKISTGFLTSAASTQNMLNKDPKIAGLWTGGYLLKDYNNSLPTMIKALHGTWWDAEDIELNQEQIKTAHKLGLKVAAWSWPEKTTKTDINIAMQKKLINLCIDGIISDRPDITKNLSQKPNKLLRKLYC